MMISTKGDPMPRFANLSSLLRRVGGQGAFDNVTAVLEARAQAHEQLNSLEARVQQAA
jgi:hypothetical protein